MKQFMPEVTAKERTMLLQENASKVEQTTYQKALTDDELASRREDLADNCIKLNQHEDELKEVKDDFKAKMDPLKFSNKTLLTEIKTKQSTVDGTLYHLANHDDSMMETYDGEGVQEIDKSKAIIVMNKKQKTIQLMVDPENYYGANVTGTLEDSEELKPFAINTTSTFDKKQLVQLLKFNKAYFNEPDKHANMLLAFQKLESTIAVTANDSANDRGNKEKLYKKEVTTNAPTEFVLTIPIFKGFPPQTFRVEICLDITDGGAARFWFESVELDTIKKSQIDEIFDTETANASDFVIINQ